MTTLKIEQFDPTQQEFCYALTENTCFRIKTGQCSLDLNYEEFENFISFEEPSENKTLNSVHYCRSLHTSFINEGIHNPIHIASNICGHYGFTDGQHRTCIAKSQNIKAIPARISINKSSKCRACTINSKNIFIG